MLKRIVILLLIFIALLVVLFSNSCVFSNIRVFSNDGQKADDRMKQIVEAIKNQNKEDLKKLFSKQALSEANDFDENTDYLFDFIQGEIISWEKADGATVVSGKESENNRIEMF